MENVKNWFEEFLKTNNQKKNLIDQIISGIKSGGFDSRYINSWISENLTNIQRSVSSKFEKKENAED